MPDENSQFTELIERVRNRDEAAAAELVRRYEGAIRRIVRINLRETQMRRVLDSMDVCQSVMASFFVRTALGQYELDSPQQLLGLLATMARNKLTSQVKRHTAQRRDMRKDAAAADDAGVAVDRASDPAEQASARELLERVRGELPAAERYLAEQRALGRGWKELAEELGATDEALRKKLTRAVDAILNRLGIDGADNG